MKRILDIGHNDLRLFLKHASAYIWLFGVPMAFVYFMGFAIRGPGDPSNHKAAVLIENQDTNFLSSIFLEELDSQGMWLVGTNDAQSAARAIRIPSDFTSKVLGKEQVKIEFTRRASSAEADAALIELRLVRALVALNGHIIEAATAETNAGGTLSEGQLRTVLGKPNPVRLNARFAGRKPTPAGFNFSLPGNLVMYLMMNLLIFGGSTMAAERRIGVIRRLMVHPVTRLQLVMGRIYGLMLLGGVQIVFFILVGKFLLNVNLGANLPAVLLVLVVFAWVAASFGVLVGSLLRAEDRVVAVCVLASLLMGALGGCWWPTEIGPPALKTIALTLPTGWALEALHQLISFGSGPEAVIKPLGVLFLFGAGANLLAARLFRS